MVRFTGQKPSNRSHYDNVPQLNMPALQKRHRRPSELVPLYFMKVQYTARALIILLSSLEFAYFFVHEVFFVACPLSGKNLILFDVFLFYSMQKNSRWSVAVAGPTIIYRNITRCGELGKYSYICSIYVNGNNWS